MQKVMAGATKIGWIGTGNMGYWMCYHCLKNGYKATVYNRTMSRATPLQEFGATMAKNPKEVGENSDVVFTIVGHPSDVKEVIAGEDGVLNGMKNGGVIVDMTTSEPQLAIELNKMASTQNVQIIDAPVSGGEAGAKNAALTIMCGGHKPTFDNVTPLFNCMGKSVNYMGSSGMGQHTKATNQILVACGLIGIVEALIYAKQAGLNLEKVIETLAPGAAGSWGWNMYGPKIANKDFKPGFMVDHFVKDMGIVLNEAKHMKISLPGLSLVHQLYVAVQAHGHGKDCVNVLTKALESLNNLKDDKQN